MSTSIMALCWNLQMPPTAKAVLISLADNANDQGFCWPSIPTISKRTCFGERAIQGAIKWLEQHGAIKADRSNGRHTTYQVTAQNYVEPPQQMRPRTEDTPALDAPTPAADAPLPPQEMRQPPQQMPSNRKEPSDEPSLNPKVKPAKKAKATLTALPDGFGISDRVRKWAAEKGYQHLDGHLENFVSAAKARSYVYADWDEAFMGAIRKDWAGLNAAQPRASPAKHPKAENFDAVDYGKSGRL